MAERSPYTTNRPLYERLYVNGPHGWGWKGACEVDDVEEHYIYHTDWPERCFTWTFFRGVDTLPDLIANGKWQLMLDPALQVSEGL